MTSRWTQARWSARTPHRRHPGSGSRTLCRRHTTSPCQWARAGPYAKRDSQEEGQSGAAPASSAVSSGYRVPPRLGDAKNCETPRTPGRLVELPVLLPRLGRLTAPGLLRAPGQVDGAQDRHAPAQVAAEDPRLTEVGAHARSRPAQRDIGPHADDHHEDGHDQAQPLVTEIPDPGGP